MTPRIDQIIDDLFPFADLGSEPPTIVKNGRLAALRMIRNSVEVELSVLQDGSISCHSEGETSKYSSFKSLLASAKFADLKRWSHAQSVLYGKSSDSLISVRGRLIGTGQEGDIGFFDEVSSLEAAKDGVRTAVVLLNGPAGIGKTTFIRQLAARRSREYSRLARPLVLHVESRGRMLQNINDLIAYSLQTLRTVVTYDQVPVLVRNGLVALAIDGFDELGDPSGYELAWAQVSELIASSRGEGTIILSGRESFINREQIERALTSLDTSLDSLNVFELQPLSPGEARDWLSGKGWPDRLLRSADCAPLFEEGSYALRPFFLTELARLNLQSKEELGAIEDLLTFLTNSLIDREAEKFGAAVEDLAAVDVRRKFVQDLMEEVARDLAENQTDTISADALSWLAEVVASEMMPESLIGILKNRASVIAFLTVDERQKFRRFTHEQFLNYFLASVTVNSINRGEVPKYVRRNILGLEFLENFGSVIRHVDGQTIDKFVENSLASIRHLGGADRARQNLASLVFVACSVANPSVSVVIEDISIDEAYFSETVSEISLNSVTINKLTAKQADLRSIKFKNCFLGSLSVDGAMIPALSLPIPVILNLPDYSISNREQIERWLKEQILSSYMNIDRIAQEELSLHEFLSKFPLFNLLFRVVRYRPFWIKDSEERAARRLLDDPHWEQLKEIMLKHDVLTVREDVPSAGRPAPFYHVKHKQHFQFLDRIPDNLKPFFSELARISFSEAGNRT